MRRRFLLLLPSAAAVASLAITTATAATDRTTVHIVGGQSFSSDVSFTDTQRFQERVTTVKSGGTVGDGLAFACRLRNRRVDDAGDTRARPARIR